MLEFREIPLAPSQIPKGLMHTPYHSCLILLRIDSLTLSYAGFKLYFLYHYDIMKLVKEVAVKYDCSKFSKTGGN